MKLHKYTATVIDNERERSFEIESYGSKSEAKRNLLRECVQNDWVLVYFEQVA